MSKNLYVYLDESGTPQINTDDLFAVGAFVSTQKISDDFFAEALNELKEDPEYKTNRLDQKTFERGFFHASEDSKNGHSYACRKIATINWPCNFYADFFEKKFLEEFDNRDLGTEQKFHHHLLSILATHFVGAKWDSIELNIAKRENSFMESSSEAWEQYFIMAISYSKIKNYRISAIIPNFQINVIDPNNTGIQICDFLLWAVQRQKQNDPIRLGRSGLKPISSYHMSERPLSGRSFYIANEIKEESILPFSKIPNFKSLTKKLTPDNVSLAMITIERLLKNITEDLIKNNQLRDRFNILMPKLKTIKISSDDIVNMAELFLLIADQIPFYNIEEPSEIETIYFYKMVCSLVADKSEIKWLLHCNQWIQIRKSIYEND